MLDIAQVLKTVVDHPTRLPASPEQDISELQEAVCPFYILSLMKGLDSIDEDRVMPSVRRFKLVPTFVNFLLLHWRNLTADALAASCEALAILFDTDDYQTEIDRYLTEELREMLVQIGDAFVEDMARSDGDLRRRIRPLLDELSSARK